MSSTLTETRYPATTMVINDLLPSPHALACTGAGFDPLVQNRGHNELPLPIEAISLILSFLPNDSSALTSAARVNHLFQLEAEFHLYRSVTIASAAQFDSYRRATEHTPRRRARLVEFGLRVERRNWNPEPSVLRYLLVPNASGTSKFPNLRHLTYPDLPTLILPIPTHENRTACRKSSLSYPKLESLQCDTDVNPNVLAFLASQPTITSLNIISQAITAVPEPHILPALQELTCRELDLELFAPGRPLKKVTMLGTIAPENLVNSVLPTLCRSSSLAHLTSLSITLFSTSRSLFTQLVKALPNLELLDVFDCMDADKGGVGANGEVEADENDWPYFTPELNGPFASHATPTLRTSGTGTGTAPSHPLHAEADPQNDAVLLKPLFAPLASLRHLARFTYDSISCITDGNPERLVNEVFSWTIGEGKSRLREIVFQGKMLEMGEHRKGWRMNKWVELNV